MSVKISKAACKVLSGLKESNRLNADAVLETAKAEDNPLHGYFEWNVNRAAYLHNIAVAKSMISTYRVTREVVDRGTVRNISVPGFLSDPASRGTYRTVESVVGSKFAKSREVIDDVLMEIASAKGHLDRALAIGLTLGFDDEIRDAIAVVTKLKIDIASKRPPRDDRRAA